MGNRVRGQALLPEKVSIFRKYLHFLLSMKTAILQLLVIVISVEGKK